MYPDDFVGRKPLGSNMLTEQWHRSVIEGGNEEQIQEFYIPELNLVVNPYSSYVVENPYDDDDTAKLIGVRQLDLSGIWMRIRNLVHKKDDAERTYIFETISSFFS